MGGWGYFDDQNDSCADEWGDLVDSFSRYKNWTADPNKDEYEQKTQFIRDYIGEFVRWMVNNGSFYDSYNISGLAMRMARQGKFSGLFSPESEGVSSWDISFLPVGVRQTAYQDSLKKLRSAESEGNVDGWRDFEKRIDALREQVLLFGGPDGKCGEE